MNDLPVIVQAVLIGAATVWLIKQVRTVITNQEKTMAKFDELDTDITAMRSEVAAAAERVERAVDRMTDDTADQAEVDAAAAEIREATAALRAIAPEAAPTPEPTPEPAPAPAPEPDQPF